MDMDNNNNNTEYANTAAYYNSYGQISDLFSSPVIPKMVIVGLNEEMLAMAPNAEVEKVKLFKEMLVKTLDNLFIIEFQDQVIGSGDINTVCIIIF